jgi:hypothetical protein
MVSGRPLLGAVRQPARPAVAAAPVEAAAQELVAAVDIFHRVAGMDINFTSHAGARAGGSREEVDPILSPSVANRAVYPYHYMKREPTLSVLPFWVRVVRYSNLPAWSTRSFSILAHTFFSQYFRE